MQPEVSFIFQVLDIGVDNMFIGRTFVNRIILFLGTLLFAVSLSGWAQDTANLVGTVTDSTGAVIPGAKVVVSNPEKGVTRDLVSNAAGEYAAPRIPIGDYMVTAEATGFQKLVRSGITLTVGQTLRVDLQMTVGQVTQEVTVTGNVARVETETGAISDVVTGSQITNLQLNGRAFTALYTLIPGAVQDNSYDPTAVGINGFAAISFNGNRMEYNNIEIDGGNNADEGSGGSSINTFPSLDSIAEFRVSSSNFGADMGKHAGATIELVTKSGTKDFHGTVFEFLRNEKLDANDWFINRTPWSSLDAQADCHGNANGPCDAPKTPLKHNEYGYNIGGPFWIPGHYNTDKSKTFFFWSESWRKYRDGIVVGPTDVPTRLMRGTDNGGISGNFSECDETSSLHNPVVASNCTLPTDPATGQPYPGNIVPISANAKALLDAYVPLPNNGVQSYLAATSQPTNWREEQVRVDQNISDKTSVFVRYTNDAWNQVAVPALWSDASTDTVKTFFAGPAKSAVLHVTHSFKSNLMNEFVMGYTVDHIRLFPLPNVSSVAGSLDKPSGWAMNNLFPANANNPLLPSVEIDGGTPFAVTGDASNHPWFNSNPVITWKDNVAWTVSKHTLKFGWYLAKFRKNEQFGGRTQGYLHFTGSGPITTGNALADMFVGRIERYTEGTTTVAGVPVGGYSKGHWRSTDFEPYFQDDWKVTRKLTLNLGLRYYYFVPIHDVSQPQTIDSGFLPGMYDPTKQAQLDADGNVIQGSGFDYTMFGNGLVECGKGGIVKGCTVAYRKTLAPRFGFAYDPFGTGKTVIRGGFGLYFEPGNGNESNTEGGEGNPPVTLAPSGYNILGYDNIVPGSYGPAGYTPIPYHQKWGSVQQFSLGIQHEFPGNNLLSLSYVGTLGRHLARNRDLNQIPIGVGTMNVPALDDTNTPHCDAQHNCDVQNVLINAEQPSIFFVPFRGYEVMGMKENTAVSHYNALQVNFRHTFGHGLTLQTAYTWSHNIDDSTSTYFQTGVDDDNLSRWRGTSDLNRTQVLVMNYIYDLPFFKNSPNRLLKGTLGGWRVSGITSFFTGQPVDFGCGITDMSSGIGGGVRCNTLGPLKIKKGIDSSDTEFGPTPTWFDPSVIGQPTLEQLRADGQAGMFGYMGRNVLTGPGRNNWDMALMKDIQLPWFKGEHSTIQFRLETFNTFNHPQWNAIKAECGGDTPPGTPCSGIENNLDNGQVSGAWRPRIMQLGLKFIF